MGVTKIRTKDPNDDKLMEICREETSSTCTRIKWTTHQDVDTIIPPDGTVAIVVDVRDIKAAIRIFAKQDDDYIDGVGTEAAGHLVVVPWQSSWFYHCTGTPRVGHVAGG
ncbi:hypothetical protein T440DRAFT_112458 [Plenodomus tracheiphilus IPT5]|uniref:Uncharacterized protein n=1 Tax=Plenodomus tracheiphilus IPT5 TaxID=1408161 RepID=A0A6A7ALS0_9PLEO|nr:hypothetical protein T440DRAFT_112458 [Plenodomus tracheiphilus IPT5]